MPEIDTDKVCFVIVRARQAALAEAEPVVSGSNASDDKFSSVYSDRARVSALHEVKAFIAAMNVDEQCELVALCWVGREDFEPEEWTAAVAEARARRERPTADYLLGLPLVAEWLEAGLAKFGQSCTDYESERL